MKAIENLRYLLWVMSQSKTFYILGAGTSYGLIPITKDIKTIIENKYHQDIGVYPITPQLPSILFERIFGLISSDEQDIQKILLSRMPQGTLDLLVQWALKPKKNNIIPPQYAIFKKVGFPSTLFNYNLDGLASRYCSSRHIVIEAHGRIDHPLFEMDSFNQLLEETAIYEIKIPYLTPKLLPSPEPKNITLGLNYTRARKLFFQALSVIIIGYSFGEQSIGLDDAESFKFFVSLLKSQPRPVFILSPSPYQLAEHLCDSLSSDDVFPIAIRWELFSSLVITMADNVCGLNKQWSNKELDRLIIEAGYL